MATRRFHEKTLDLLPSRPAVTRFALDAVDALESRLGRPLPASVREWYSHTDAAGTLERYSNQNPTVPLSESGLPTHQERDGRDLGAEGLLVFRYENQGVCTWAVRLDESDDPPVVVSYDCALQTWHQSADTFTDYVYTCVWDCTLVLTDDELVIQAQNDPVSETTLQSLRRLFAAGVTTHGWPWHTQYRFERGDQYLLIWAGEGQADWFLSADSERSISEALESIWELDRVGEAFWSNSDVGQAIIDRLRSAR